MGRKIEPSPKQRWKHGTRTGYQRGCRCLPCVRVNATWLALWRRDTGRVKDAPYRFVGKKAAQHGTRAKYVAGCRCDRCTKANRDYQRPYMQLHRTGERLIDPLIEQALQSGM